jgi:hypothetical protein
VKQTIIVMQSSQMYRKNFANKNWKLYQACHSKSPMSYYDFMIW